jgi:hypothetical protein
LISHREQGNKARQDERSLIEQGGDAEDEDREGNNGRAGRGRLRGHLNVSNVGGRGGGAGLALLGVSGGPHDTSTSTSRVNVEGSEDVALDNGADEVTLSRGRGTITNSINGDGQGASAVIVLNNDGDDNDEVPADTSSSGITIGLNIPVDIDGVKASSISGTSGHLSSRRITSNSRGNSSSGVYRGSGGTASVRGGEVVRPRSVREARGVGRGTDTFTILLSAGNGTSNGNRARAPAAFATSIGASTFVSDVRASINVGGRNVDIIASLNASLILGIVLEPAAKDTRH